MKKNILLLSVMAVLISAVFLTMTAEETKAWGGGAVTCSAPTTFDAGTASVNFTISEAGVAGWNITNCTVFIRSAALTLNTTWTDIGTSTDLFNHTGLGNGSVTLSAGDVEDGTDYEIRGMCVNSTGVDGAGNWTGNCTALTGRIVDFTRPDCTHYQSSNTEYSPKQTWTVAGGNASTSATSATITFGSQAARTMAEGAGKTNIFTWTGDINTLPEGIYDSVVARTSDGTNETVCTLSYVKIDSESTLKSVGGALAGAQAAKLAEADGGMGNKKTFFTIMIVGVGLWYIMRKKK